MSWWDYIPTGTGGPDWINVGTLFGTVEGRWVGQGWQAMALSAVLASFFMISIAWMIAAVFNHAGLKRWVRSEAYQVLANALMVVGLVGLVSMVLTTMTVVTADIAEAIVPGPTALQYSEGYQGPGTGTLTGQTVDNPFVLAQLFLDENIQCLRAWYLNAFIADSFLEPIEQLSVGVAGMDAVSASTALNPIISMLYFMSHNTTFLLLANYFQRHLLVFIYQTMFTVFLPIGIILRTLPVTRGMGGFFIAVAIGLYVVYPVAYSGMLLTTRQGNYGNCGLTIDAMELRGVQVNDLAAAEYHRAKAERYLPIISQSISLYQNSVPFLLMRSLLMPLVSLSLVFTFVRGTAGFFGADIAEVSRGLIKLI